MSHNGITGSVGKFCIFVVMEPAGPCGKIREQLVKVQSMGSDGGYFPNWHFDDRSNKGLGVRASECAHRLAGSSTPVTALHIYFIFHYFFYRH